MPIDQVTELLVRWRDTDGVFARARVLREGIQLLGGLDAEERGLLARSLAEQGAPDLANQLEQRTGGALSADQLWSVADGLLAMDDRQVDRLATSLRDPAERERLAREALAPGPGAQQLGDQQLGDQDLGTIALGDAGIVDVGLHGTDASTPTIAARTQDHDGEGDEVAQQVRLTETGPAVRSGSTVASPRADQGPAELPVIDAGPGVPVALPLAVESVMLDGEGTTTVPDDAAAWHEQLRQARTAMARFRLLDPDRLAGLDSAMAMALLDVLPEGWQRRRGAQRLVDAGAFPTDQLAEAFTRFARAADAAFVAGSLLAADQVRAERFEGILPRRVVHRLVARSER